MLKKLCCILLCSLICLTFVTATTTFFNACVFPTCIHTCFPVCVLPDLSFGWWIRIFTLSLLAATGCFLFCSKYVFPTHIQDFIVSLYAVSWRRNYDALGLSEMEWVLIRYKYSVLLVGSSRRWTICFLMFRSEFIR